MLHYRVFSFPALLYIVEDEDGARIVWQEAIVETPLQEAEEDDDAPVEKIFYSYLTIVPACDRVSLL